LKPCLLWSGTSFAPDQTHFASWSCSNWYMDVSDDLSCNVTMWQQFY